MGPSEGEGGLFLYYFYGMMPTCSQVWAADSVPERLALAGRLGAMPLDLTALDVVDAVRGATEGR